MSDEKNLKRRIKIPDSVARKNAQSEDQRNGETAGFQNGKRFLGSDKARHGINVGVGFRSNFRTTEVNAFVGARENNGYSEVGFEHNIGENKSYVTGTTAYKKEGAVIGTGGKIEASLNFLDNNILKDPKKRIDIAQDDLTSGKMNKNNKETLKNFPEGGKEIANIQQFTQSSFANTEISFGTIDEESQYSQEDWEKKIKAAREMTPEKKMKHYQNVLDFTENYEKSHGSSITENFLKEVTNFQKKDAKEIYGASIMTDYKFKESVKENKSIEDFKNQLKNTVERNEKKSAIPPEEKELLAKNFELKKNFYESRALVSKLSDPNTGVSAWCFANKKKSPATMEIYYGGSAFGTQKGPQKVKKGSSGIGDAANDGFSSMMVTKNQESALAFARRMKFLHPEMKLDLVAGHSKGGGEAIYVASKLEGVRCLASDPSPVYEPGKFVSDNRILALTGDGDGGTLNTVLSEEGKNVGYLFQKQGTEATGRITALKIKINERIKETKNSRGGLGKIFENHFLDGDSVEKNFNQAKAEINAKENNFYASEDGKLSISSKINYKRSDPYGIDSGRNAEIKLKLVSKDESEAAKKNPISSSEASQLLMSGLNSRSHEKAGKEKKNEARSR